VDKFLKLYPLLIPRCVGRSLPRRGAVISSGKEGQTLDEPRHPHGFLLSQVLWQCDVRAYTGLQRKLMLDQWGARRDIAAVGRPWR
jgi:hypothetical protein